MWGLHQCGDSVIQPHLLYGQTGQDTQVAERLSENSEPLDRHISAQTQLEASKWTRIKQQRREGEIRHPHPSTNTGCGNESLLKSASSQESAERHLVLITLLADSRMSPLFVSASSVLLYLPFWYALRFSQHHSVSVFFLSFSLPLSSSVFSGSCPGVLLIPWRCLFSMEVIRERSTLSSSTRPVVVPLLGDEDRPVTWTRPPGLTHPLAAYLQPCRLGKDRHSQQSDGTSGVAQDRSITH